MAYPNGSVQGLCSSAAACFALSIAFLGVWGFQGAGPWRGSHLLVLGPLMAGVLCFGVTPFFATRPVPEPEQWARWSYLGGVVLATCAIGAALYVSFTSVA